MFFREDRGRFHRGKQQDKRDLPWEIKTETINKVCASGMRSVTLADQIIRSGDEEVIVAGGMESMSQAPYLLRKHAGACEWGSLL